MDPPLDGTKRITRTGLRSFRHWGHATLAVNLCTAWTDFAEDIFLGCVNRNATNVGKNLGLQLPEHLQYSVCEALFSLGGYLDFRSIGDLKGKAKTYLVTNPFQAISKAEERLLDELSVLRNYVVHQSRRARKAYRETVLRTNNYKNLVEPGSFLLRTVKGKTRLELYLAAAASAARAVEAAIK